MCGRLKSYSTAETIALQIRTCGAIQLRHNSFQAGHTSIATVPQALNSKKNISDGQLILYTIDLLLTSRQKASFFLSFKAADSSSLDCVGIDMLT